MPPQFSEAVQAAKARRKAGALRAETRVEWFIDQVLNNVNLTVKQRVALVTRLVRDTVVRNIGIAVVKEKISGVTVVTKRSKVGEYPRADTTLLMKTIFDEVKDLGGGVFEGYVGTPLDYGLILELEMGRPFLVRTLKELQPRLKNIMTKPI